MAKKKSKIIVADVMKVMDVRVGCVSTETIKFLQSHFFSYADNGGLKEHLLRITMGQDELEKLYKNNCDTSIIKSEIAELMEIAITNDAAYVRFISF